MSTSVSSVSSHFPKPQDGFTTTTSGSISSGATSVGLNSTGSYANGDVVVLIIDPTDANKKQAFTGVVDTSGVQITSVVWTSGTNQNHSAGATVVDYVAATHTGMISKGALVSHNQDGTPKAGITYPASTFLTPVIADHSSATHTHATNAQGGKITSAGITSFDTSLTTISNPYKFSVYQAGAFTGPPASYTKVLFDTELYDTSSNFASSTYTVPVAGFYQFNWMLSQSQVNGTGNGAGLAKNGSVIANGAQIISGFTTAFALSTGGSTLVQCAANDTMEMYGIGNSLTGVPGMVATFFNGFLVSRT